MQSLSDSYRCLVIGNTGTIGREFELQLRQDPRCGLVLGISRKEYPFLNLLDEATIQRSAHWAAAHGPYQLIVDATGVLTIDGRGPEKRLADIEQQGLIRSFEINAIGRGLVLKHFIPLLDATQRSIFAVMSARVGSISDNRLGGWYGYRAAKAAGNMILQTAAVESYRTRPQCVFAALQPGTVPSQLSAPYIGSHQTVDAASSITGMLAALDRLKTQPQAWFVDYRGNEIGW